MKVYASRSEKYAITNFYFTRSSVLTNWFSISCHCLQNEPHLNLHVWKSKVYFDAYFVFLDAYCQMSLDLFQNYAIF